MPQNHSQTNVSLTYYPKPYVVSPYRGSLTTVWYLDYAHLLFWFFFLNLFVTFLALVFFFIALSKYSETREVIRETRGFSRAQTGDLLTATMPLTWSATMIIHANTHSGNFDENTSMTSFALSVIAYQWGWNYFFPVDLLHRINELPLKVGSSGILVPTNDNYSALLAEARLDYWSRINTRSKHLGRQGRGSLGHVAATYSHASLVEAVNNFPISQTITSLPINSELPSKIGSNLNFSGILGDAGAEALTSRFFGLSTISSRKVSTLLRNLSIDNSLSLLSNNTSCTDLVSNLKPAAESNTSDLYLGGRFRQSFFIVGNRTTTLSQHLKTPSNWIMGYNEPDKYSISFKLKQLSNIADIGFSGNDFMGVNNTRSDWFFPITIFNVRLNHSVFGNYPLRAYWACRLISETPRFYPNSTLVSTDMGQVSPAALAEANFKLLATSLFTAKDSLFNSNLCYQNKNTTNLNSSIFFLYDFRFLFTQDHCSSPFKYASNLPLKLNNLAEQDVFSRLLPHAARANKSNASDSTRTTFAGGTSTLLKNTPLVVFSGFGLNSNSSLLVDVIGDSINRSTLCSCFTNLTTNYVYIDALGTVATLPRTAITANSNVNHRPTTAASCAHLASGDLVCSTALYGNLNWLVGATSFPPIRASVDIDWDAGRLNFKLSNVDLRTLASSTGNNLLFSWKWSWSTDVVNLPVDKFYRGSITGRPNTPYWSNSFKFDKLNNNSSYGALAPKFDKNTLDLYQPELAFMRSSYWYPEFNTTLTDSERSFLFPVFPVVLPAPYLDIDPSFMLGKWLMGINTTRRGNHANKYRLSWGKLLSGDYAAERALQTSSLLDQSITPTPALLNSVIPSDIANLASIGYSELLSQQSSVNSSIVSRLYANVYGISPVVRFSALKPAYAPFCRLLSTQPTPSQGLNWLLLPENGSSFTDLSKLGTGFNSTYFSLRLATASALRDKYYFLDFSKHYNKATYNNSNDINTSDSSNSRHGFLPLRENIGSLRRLRLTRGLCLPAMLPIHGIFGSKDVIHSWAIPGLGLKVDCIPGYNSHRRLFLAWRGAFWGQCMEVCGRYHHWMPILVRVVQKDTFLTWCACYLEGLRLRDRVQSYGFTEIQPIKLFVNKM